MTINLDKYWLNYADIMKDRAANLIREAGGVMPLDVFEDNYLPPYCCVLRDHLIKIGLARISHFDMTIKLCEQAKEG